MGGQVAMVTAAHFPEYVKSLILIGTSTDFKVGFDAFEGKNRKEKDLSPPDADYIKFASKKLDFSNMSNEEILKTKIDYFINLWKRHDGNSDNFDLDYYQKLGYLTFTRTKLHASYFVHARSMKASYELHENAPALVNTPTLIIQGAKDPIFPLDHGEDLNHKIKDSKLVILKDFGHAINPRVTDTLLNEIMNFIDSSSSQK